VDGWELLRGAEHELQSMAPVLFDDGGLDVLSFGLGDLGGRFEGQKLARDRRREWLRRGEGR